jgi:trk system potassium uptake protein
MRIAEERVGASAPSRSDQPIPRKRSLFAGRPALKIVLGLFALVCVGTALMLIPGAATRPLTPTEAIFTAVSALTVTGLSVIVPSTDLTALGELILLLLIQVGGVGYMTLAVTAFRLMGRKVSLADRLALTDSLGLVTPQGIVELTRQIFRTVATVEIVGAVLLWLHWRTFMPEGRAAYYAVFHSVSAFCNAGFDLFSGHPQHLEGVPQDNVSLLILGSLIFLGGIGIPVFFDLFMYRRRRRLSLHTRVTIPLKLTLVLLGAAAIYLSERLLGGVLEGVPTDRAVVMALFQSVSSRTAGFVGMPDFASIGGATELSVMSLMFIGCAPASMGGGITTGTLAVLILSLWAYARGRDKPRIKGRELPGTLVRRAISVVVASISVIVFSTWLLLVSHDLPFDRVAFEVVSAFATCGLSMGITGDLNDFGRMVLVGVMFWGRLGALTIFVAAVRPAPRAYRYPEERILVG